MSVTTSAHELGCSRQTIRNWLHEGKLAGAQRENGRWDVDAAGVNDHLVKLGRKRSASSDTTELAGEVRRLATVVEELEQRESSAATALEALTRERDRYRAEAATMREAAIRLNAAAADAHGAMRQTLTVLEQQREALAQLLAPGSPDQLTR